MIGEISKIKNRKNDLRNFGVIVGLIFLTISGYLFWIEKESFQIFLMVGILLFLVGIAIPIILKPIYLVWMYFGIVLGKIMTLMILSIMFYLIVTPIGLISKCLGKKFMELKTHKTNSTYWKYRPNVELKKEKYEKQY